MENKFGYTVCCKFCGKEKCANEIYCLNIKVAMCVISSDCAKLTQNYVPVETVALNKVS